MGVQAAGLGPAVLGRNSSLHHVQLVSCRPVTLGCMGTWEMQRLGQHSTCKVVALLPAAFMTLHHIGCFYTHRQIAMPTGPPKMTPRSSRYSCLLRMHTDGGVAVPEQLCHHPQCSPAPRAAASQLHTAALKLYQPCPHFHCSTPRQAPVAVRRGLLWEGRQGALVPQW